MTSHDGNKPDAAFELGDIVVFGPTKEIGQIIERRRHEIKDPDSWFWTYRVQHVSVTRKGHPQKQILEKDELDLTIGNESCEERFRVWEKAYAATWSLWRCWGFSPPISLDNGYDVL